MPLPGNQLLALLVAISFAAGLNVYATVATLGLLAHTKYIELPQQLNLLSNWWIIGAAGVLFAIGFVADKIPAFDLVWNALHTFVRVPVAGLLAWQATSTLSPGMQLAATLAGGAIAFVAHGGKTAIRTAVTSSPEPLSNVGLSLGEDFLSVSLTWFATAHPYAAAGIAAVLVLLTLFLIRWIWSSLKNLFRTVKQYI
jgi:hypothetical protein